MHTVVIRVFLERPFTESLKSLKKKKIPVVRESAHALPCVGIMSNLYHTDQVFLCV